MTQVDGMGAADYFGYAADLLKINPPHITDQPILARMRRIGIEPGKPFQLSAADPVVRHALERAAPDGLKAMREKIPTLARVVNGWQMNTDTMGVYGNFYLKRAVVARAGLGANQPDDAIYPLLLADSDGAPLDGSHDYAWHLDAAELPPVDAFWSVTMYDEHGFQAANPLGRFALGDRDPLTHNSDGSLDIYIQHVSPGPDREPNWLPAPAGPLGVTLRLYAPRNVALDGRWNPPPVRRVR
jgi:hypothetical protein